MLQEHKEQNLKLSTPMNFQQNHNALTTQKKCRCVFWLSKLKKLSVAKTRG